MAFDTVGAAICGVAILTAVRRHVVTAKLPPSELAIHHWRRAKQAAKVGRESWRFAVVTLPDAGVRPTTGSTAFVET
jgi:hypothetical protein